MADIKEFKGKAPKKDPNKRTMMVCDCGCRWAETEALDDYPGLYIRSCFNCANEYVFSMTEIDDVPS